MGERALQERSFHRASYAAMRVLKESSDHDQGWGEIGETARMAEATRVQQDAKNWDSAAKILEDVVVKGVLHTEVTAETDSGS